jgi:hypothetical protein
MRAIACVAVALAACGSTPGPRVIHGGGIGDGSIDGTLHVYVIDHDTEQPIQGATVEVGTKQDTTDKTGLANFSVSGAQTVTVSASGYRGTVWMKADGVNVTIPVTKLGAANPDRATLSGSINNWASITVPVGHAKAALVLYSQTDKLGDPANNIATGGMANVCGVANPTTCDWSVVTRTGAVTLIAVIVDIAPGNVQSVIGWAMKTGLQVDSGIDQSGIALDLIDAGNLENVTIDYGSPPAALTTKNAIVGYEISSDEIVQLPVVPAGSTTLLAPKPTVFAPKTTRRLTASAQSTTMPSATSIVLVHAITGSTLTAGTWLDPPTNAMITHTGASFGPVTGAKVHQVQWSDANGVVLEITCFDDTTTTFDVPALVAPNASALLAAQVSSFAATFSVTDFSLDDDRDKITSVSAQPATVN